MSYLYCRILMNTNQSSTVSTSAVRDRIMSIDALRGFDMFWIIGAEEVVHAIAKVAPNYWTQLASYQMDHSKWVGFRFYDLIFPMFPFI